MSNLIGTKVLVYDGPTIPPYEAIVRATQIAADGVELITQVAPIKDPTRVLDVSNKVVTFVASPLGKQIINWLFGWLKRKKK